MQERKFEDFYWTDFLQIPLYSTFSGNTVFRAILKKYDKSLHEDKWFCRFRVGQEILAIGLEDVHGIFLSPDLQEPRWNKSPFRTEADLEILLVREYKRSLFNKTTTGTFCEIYGYHKGVGLGSPVGKTSSGSRLVNANADKSRYFEHETGRWRISRSGQLLMIADAILEMVYK